jgi:hypothetical protein
MVPVPEGVVTVTRDAVQILRGAGWSKAHLSSLQAQLESLRNAPDRAALVAVLHREPLLAPIADRVPWSRSEIIALVAMLLAALQLFVSCAEKPDTTINIDIEQVINRVYQMHPPAPAAPEASAPTAQSGKRPTTVPEVGRNDPCPCGSGKKYKKCHGGPGGR